MALKLGYMFRIGECELSGVFEFKWLSYNHPSTIITLVWYFRDFGVPLIVSFESLLPLIVIRLSIFALSIVLLSNWSCVFSFDCASSWLQ